MAMVSADSASLRKCARSADWARSRRRGVSVGHSHLLDCRLLPTQPPSASAARTTVPMDVASLAERSEEHTSELQSRLHLVCRLLLEKKKRNDKPPELSDPVSVLTPALL